MMFMQYAQRERSVNVVVYWHRYDFPLAENKMPAETIGIILSGGVTGSNCTKLTVGFATRDAAKFTILF